MEAVVLTYRIQFQNCQIIVGKHIFIPLNIIISSVLVAKTKKDGH